MNPATQPLTSEELGLEKAGQVLGCIRSGAPGDRLHTALQDIRSTGDGDQLRAFTREIQRELARRC